MTKGLRQERRDEKFAERLENGPKYEFWRASGHLAWIYGYNYKDEVICESLPMSFVRKKLY